MAVRLNSKIWDKGARSDAYAKALYLVGQQAIKDIQEYQDQSVPAGITYRRGAIVRTATKRNAVKGLRMTEKRGKQARIVGYNIHKASAKGQPPAKDTKRLYKGNRVRRIAAYHIRIFNNVPYSKHLEPPAKLHRPFFRVPIVRNRAKYREIVRASVGELL